MLRKVAIIGAGMTRFGKHPEKSLIQLFLEASEEALESSGIENLDGLVMGSMTPGLYEGITGPANILAGLLGVEGGTVLRAENTSGSGGAALYTGWLTVASGMADTMLVTGGEKMTHKSTAENTAIIAGLVHEYERSLGVTLPSYAALMARMYMHKYNAPNDALAEVAIKNHLHGSMNPKAHFQKVITKEDYYRSRIVADPLRVMDFTPISDGAATVILAPLDKAYSYTSKPIIVKAVAGATDTHVIHERQDLLFMNGVKISVEKALRKAVLEKKDIDIIELHDMATVLELVELESMGIYSMGESWKAVMNGETRFNGELPVNTSGGLKAKGHPIGATGVAQAYEISMQMWGKAGKRQVKKNIRHALSMSMGGFGNNSYTAIYEKGW